MEAAAKNIKILADKVLPQRPHQLSLSMTRRYCIPPNSEEFEEQQIRPLQYMTFVSEADRGVLYTRAYYDIREDDAPIAAPKPSLLAAPEIKKKLSLKDYKNKKNAQTSPAEPSPLHPQVQSQPQSQPPPPTSSSSTASSATSAVTTTSSASATTATTKASSTNFSTSNTAPQQRNSLPPRPPVAGDAAKKPAETKPAMAEKVRDLKVASSRDRLDDDRSRKLPPKPDFTRGRSPSLEKRKRDHELEDPRSLKRSKPENGAFRDSSKTPRIDGIKPVDSRDKKHPFKDGRPGSSPLVNGRSALGAATNGRTSSPRPSSRDAGAFNGQRTSGSNSTTPRKDTNKLPPLLSPLHPSLMAGEDGSSTTGNKKKPLDKSGERASSKLSAGHRLGSRKPKPKIPPLLSPTLPPIVEQELARIKKTPTKGEPSSQRAQNPPDSPTSARKPRLLEREEDPPPPKKKSLVVVLKYKKKNAKRVHMILALPSSSVTEARRKEREREKERSRSLDPGPPPPSSSAPTSAPASQLARKRPKPHESDRDLAFSTHASKKPRTSEVGRGDSLVPAAPSTPSKSAPAMARVASNSSIMHTPGDTTALTPPTNQARERSSRPPDEETLRAADKLRREGQNYIGLGTRLKHQRDDIMGYKNREHPKPLPHQLRRGCAVGVESLMAYLIGFKMLNEGRDMEKRGKDLGGFESLIPHLRIMQRETRPFTALQAVVLVMAATVMEELEGLMVSSLPGAGVMEMQPFASWGRRMAELARMRMQYWDNARQGMARMRETGWGSSAGRLEQMGPWTSAEEVLAVGMMVLKRWVDEEGVDWMGELTVPARDRDKDRELNGVS